MIASPTSPNLYSQHHSSSSNGNSNSSRSSPRNVWNRPVSRSSRSSMLAGKPQQQQQQQLSASASLTDMQSTSTHSPRPREHFTRDVGTQYSPPEIPETGPKPGATTGKRKGRDADSPESVQGEGSPQKPRLTPRTHVPAPTPANPVQSATAPISTPSQAANTSAHTGSTSIKDEKENEEAKTSSTNIARPSIPGAKLLPSSYEDCPTSDLVPIIASMLLELIRHNDDMPVTHTGLTRFHSRAPPGISVQDYLQRLAHHATLSPPILLAMVYYIDRMCSLWPKFTINSLTVHRYLIASATVASKGLSDSFWTNATYARVGGVSLKELALLELEFLWRIEWRIVPKPEVLVDYYRSLVQRCDGYEIDTASSAPHVASGSESSSSGSGSSEGLADAEMSG